VSNRLLREALRSDTITECKKVSIEAPAGRLSPERLPKGDSASRREYSQGAFYGCAVAGAGYKPLIPSNDRNSKKGGVRYVALGSKLPVTR
jgi:hypothetical protein